MLPGAWEPSAHCCNINFCIRWIVSIEVSWPNSALSFVRTQGLLDSRYSLAFQSLYYSPPSNLAPFKEPLLLNKCLMGATIFFILLMWKGVNRSTQWSPPSVAGGKPSCLPESALLPYSWMFLFYTKLSLPCHWCGWHCMHHAVTSHPFTTYYYLLIIYLLLFTNGCFCANFSIHASVLVR